MTIKELKEQYGINNDNAKIELLNGVLTLVENKPTEYRFNVGDKVVYPLLASAGEIMTITEKLSVNGRPCYNLISDNNVKVLCMEDDIHSCILQGITERIKTLEDAIEWCNKNHKSHLTGEYEKVSGWLLPTSDLLAYLKLRIITAALNEGWKPTYETYSRYAPVYSSNGGHGGLELSLSYFGDASSKLCFKSEELAIYAAKQFKDIYADFCGCGEGGEK